MGENENARVFTPDILRADDIEWYIVVAQDRGHRDRAFEVKMRFEGAVHHRALLLRIVFRVGGKPDGCVVIKLPAHKLLVRLRLRVDLLHRVVINRRNDTAVRVNGIDEEEGTVVDERSDHVKKQLLFCLGCRMIGELRITAARVIDKRQVWRDTLVVFIDECLLQIAAVIIAARIIARLREHLCAAVCPGTGDP